MNSIYPTGTPTNTQDNNNAEGKKASKCCLSKPAIIAIVVVAVLLAITIPVILFTVVLKDDESFEETLKKEHDARPNCIERNTKELDMMRRFAQINTNGDQNLSAVELLQAYKDHSSDFTESAFKSDIHFFD